MFRYSTVQGLCLACAGEGNLSHSRSSLRNSGGVFFAFSSVKKVCCVTFVGQVALDFNREVSFVNGFYTCLFLLCFFG